jgi:hypothetical protein
MKIFEFHFNPQTKPDLIFDSYCYEPANRQEQKLGSLYIVGELRNAIPQDARLLPNLALLLKREYFSALTSDSAMKKALKRANDFLAERTKLGSVRWLGNLSVAVLGFQDFNLNFSKDGKVKVLLLRPGQITDIGKTLESEEFEPYPLKIFTNIINGKFLENDKIIVLTEVIFDYFYKTGFLEKLSLAQTPKVVKELFQARDDFSTLSGVCFLLFLTKEASPKSELIFKKITTPLSFKEILSPLVHVFTKQSLKKLLSKLSLFKTNFLTSLNQKKSSLVPIKSSKIQPKPFLPELPHISFKWPRLILPKFSLPRIKFILDFKDEKTKKDLILVAGFAVLLLLGIFLSGYESKLRQNEFRNQFLQIQEEIIKANGYLVLGQDDKANVLLKKAYGELSPLTKANSPVATDALNLKTSLEKKLLPLNKIEEIAEPKAVFDFTGLGFSPQYMVAFKDDLYFFSPFQKGIFKLSSNGKAEKIAADSGFSLASADNSSVFFFAKPDKIATLSGSQLKGLDSLRLPSTNTQFVSLATLEGSLYFLEGASGEIIKYSSFLNGSASPQNWILPLTQKVYKAKSLEVLDAVYVLSSDNSLWQYRSGRLEKEIKLDIFPLPQRLTKVISSPLFDKLALLEPSQKRIIIIDRQGVLIKQFESEKFASLKDIAFSADGKNIYIFNSSQVYKLKI